MLVTNGKNCGHIVDKSKKQKRVKKNWELCEKGDFVSVNANIKPCKKNTMRTCAGFEFMADSTRIIIQW